MIIKLGMHADKPVYVSSWGLCSFANMNLVRVVTNYCFVIFYSSILNISQSMSRFYEIENLHVGL